MSAPETDDILTNDTTGKLASWGCGSRRPPRRYFFASGSGGFAARTTRKTKCFLEGKTLQTSHLSKPAVSLTGLRQHIFGSNVPAMDQPGGSVLAAARQPIPAGAAASMSHPVGHIWRSGADLPAAAERGRRSAGAPGCAPGSARAGRGHGPRAEDTAIQRHVCRMDGPA